MRVIVTSLSDVEVSGLDIDAAFKLDDLQTLQPEQAGGIVCSRRLFSGKTELMGQKKGSILTLVFRVMLRVLTASHENSAKIWSAASRGYLLTLRGHGCRVSSAAFSADDQQVLTASDDGSAKLWAAASGECLSQRPCSVLSPIV